MLEILVTILKLIFGVPLWLIGCLIMLIAEGIRWFGEMTVTLGFTIFGAKQNENGDWVMEDSAN